jgi:thiol-disulfide isomerase/thioredoxin
MENKSPKTRIIIFVLILVAIIGLMTMVVRGSATAGKYSEFVTALKDSGAKFYGAFWCPHCQAQEKALDASRQTLERAGLYIECSTPDGQNQKQICNDNRIESYPTWTFPNGLKITYAEEPAICEVTAQASEDASCKNVRSKIFRVRIFKGIGVVASETDPTRVGDVWNFVPGSQLRGEIDLDVLAEQAGILSPKAQATAGTEEKR